MYNQPTRHLRNTGEISGVKNHKTLEAQNVFTDGLWMKERDGIPVQGTQFFIFVFFIHFLLLIE